MDRPSAQEFAPFYAPYIALVPEGPILETLESQRVDTRTLLDSISEPDSLRLHAPYTWTARDVVGHLIDSERIFAYRALRFARDDTTPLPGFDENAYAQSAQASRIPLPHLADEFDAVRASNILLFRGLDPDTWTRGGLANNAHITVRALAHILAGHVFHHTAILRKRLGLPIS